MDLTALQNKLRFPVSGKGLILHAPQEWEEAFLSYYPDFEVDAKEPAEWVLVFVSNHAEMATWGVKAVSATSETGTCWVAFPKKSGKVASDLNRDQGWQPIEAMGWAPVTNVSLDENWSVLRWKPISAIPVMKRGQSAVEIPVPPELEALLQDHPEANQYFQSLAPSHRREYLVYITEAKKPETRERRLAKTLDMLIGKQKNPTS